MKLNNIFFFQSKVIHDKKQQNVFNIDDNNVDIKQIITECDVLCDNIDTLVINEGNSPLFENILKTNKTLIENHVKNIWVRNPVNIDCVKEIIKILSNISMKDSAIYNLPENDMLFVLKNNCV